MPDTALHLVIVSSQASLDCFSDFSCSHDLDSFGKQQLVFYRIFLNRDVSGVFLMSTT